MTFSEIAGAAAAQDKLSADLEAAVGAFLDANPDVQLESLRFDTYGNTPKATSTMRFDVEGSTFTRSTA